VKNVLVAALILSLLVAQLVAVLLLLLSLLPPPPLLLLPLLLLLLLALPLVLPPGVVLLGPLSGGYSARILRRITTRGTCRNLSPRTTRGLRLRSSGQLAPDAHGSVSILADLLSGPPVLSGGLKSVAVASLPPEIEVGTEGLNS
jgi:hypothetical protein